VKVSNIKPESDSPDLRRDRPSHKWMVKYAIPLALLGFIPISLAAVIWHWSPLAVCLTSAIAILGLSIWLSTATEKVAVVTGPSVGGVMNAVFGNATQLIVALAALRAGLIDIVKASITGSILSDLLLFLGLAMLVGGLRYKEQEFKPILARVNGSSMTIAISAIALPTLVIYTSNVVDPIAIRNLSVVVAVVLIVVYALTLIFSLRTHSYLYDVGIVIDRSEELDDQTEALVTWITVLLAATILVAVESEIFVDVVGAVIQRFGLTPLFTGVIFLPLVGDIAGVITVTRLAAKNQMDLTVATAMGDSLLIALFVAPILVLVGLALGQPIDLNFNPFEVVALAIAITVTNLISFNGRSNWLDGSLLLATYIVLGVAFYYHPA
jgi:Ca2+:H+ antiporter